MALVMWCASARAQTVVIVSTKNPLSKLTADQVSQIFLGQTSTFYTGGKAEPLDQAEGSPLRQEFYTKVLGKSQAQLKAHWSKQAFSGKGNAPTVLSGNAEVVKKVAENPKYISYVDKSAVDGSVKVVTIQ
jgi:ABC-type phosphate transport system substrate-binding protein